MAFCYKCGVTLPDGSGFCQSCETKQDTRAQGLNTNQPTTQTPSNQGLQNWANRHINWAYTLGSSVGGYVVGFSLSLIGLGVVGVPAALILTLLMARWLLKRKGRSMCFIPLGFIPILWLILLFLENRRVD